MEISGTPTNPQNQILQPLPPSTPQSPPTGQIGAQFNQLEVSGTPTSPQNQVLQPLPPATPATPASSTAGSSAGDVASISNFGPGNDLLYSEIDPATGQRLSGTQGQVDTAAGNVANAPDLQTAAEQQLNAYIAETDPQYQQDLRAVGQKAAALGRVGAGMTTNDLTDVSTQRSRDILDREQALAGSTAAASNTQNLQNLSALSGLESQQFGENTSTDEQLREERAYQAQTDQNALNQNANQIALQDQLLNSATNRNLAETGQEASVGFGNDPTTALLAQGGYYGDQAAQTGQAASNLAGNIAYLSTIPSVTQPTQGATPSTGGNAPAPGTQFSYYDPVTGQPVYT